MGTQDEIVLDDGAAGSITVSDAPDEHGALVTAVIAVRRDGGGWGWDQNSWLVTPAQLEAFGRALVAKYGKKIVPRRAPVPPPPHSEDAVAASRAQRADIAARTVKKL